MGFTKRSKLEFTFKDKTLATMLIRHLAFYLPNFAFYFFVSEVGYLEEGNITRFSLVSEHDPSQTQTAPLCAFIGHFRVTNVDAKWEYT